AGRDPLNPPQALDLQAFRPEDSTHFDPAGSIPPHRRPNGDHTSAAAYRIAPKLRPTRPPAQGCWTKSVPARAQHSVSLKAITARQLQALDRRRPSQGGWSYHQPARYMIRATTVPVETTMATNRQFVVTSSAYYHHKRGPI